MGWKNLWYLSDLVDEYYPKIGSDKIRFILEISDTPGKVKETLDRILVDAVFRRTIEARYSNSMGQTQYEFDGSGI